MRGSRHDQVQRMALRVSGSRGRALRALLSLLAGGGLSAVGAGGVFSAQAAGSQTRSTASGDSAMPITVTESGSESGAAQGEAAPGSQSTHTTTGSTTLTPPASSTTTGTTGTSATPPPRTTTAEEIVVATPPSSTAATAPPAVVHQREQKATSGQGQTSTAAGKGARGAAARGALPARGGRLEQSSRCDPRLQPLGRVRQLRAAAREADLPVSQRRHPDPHRPHRRAPARPQQPRGVRLDRASSVAVQRHEGDGSEPRRSRNAPRRSCAWQ